MKKISFFFVFLISQLLADAVDVVVFSCDRPMQLYAFLESLFHYASHIRETRVIYRCRSLEYENAYAKVFSAFPEVKPVKQVNPPADFRLLVFQEAFKDEAAEYIAFAVDDIIVTREIDFDECIEVMEKTQAHGFYLRLGQNIEDCYSSGHFQEIPPMTNATDIIYLWEFKKGIGDWTYPNSLDMTIFRKKDVEERCRKGSFSNPNTLEDLLGNGNMGGWGLCYENSCVMNLPLNVVSHTTATEQLNITPEFLLEEFNFGLKIDVSKLFHYKNRSTHVYDCQLSYIPRVHH